MALQLLYFGIENAFFSKSEHHLNVQWIEKLSNAHNSPLEGATQLKQASLDLSFLKTFWLPKIKPWVVVHGFWPEFEYFDFGKKRYDAIAYLKASSLTKFQLQSTFKFRVVVVAPTVLV